MNVDQIRSDLCEVGRRVFQHGWVASNDGNFSVRLGENEFLVTPTGVSKGFMTPEKMVLVNLEGETLQGEGQVSSEWKMHRISYERREDISAIVHTHCPHATAFTVAGLALDQCVLPEQIYALGAIPLAPYGQPGTEDLYQGMLPFIEKSNAFLLKNHGVVTFGSDLWEAFFRHEALEHAARIQFLARQLGKVETLSRDQVEALHRARTQAGLDPHWIDCRCEGEEELDR